MGAFQNYHFFKNHNFKKPNQTNPKMSMINRFAFLQILRSRTFGTFI